MAGDRRLGVGNALSLSRLPSTTFAQLFLYFAKSNSTHTLVDLIYSRDTYLILPIYLHIHSHTFLIFLSKCAGYFNDVRQEQGSYLLVRRRTIFLSQLEGNLSSNQLVGQLLDLLLDGHKSAGHGNWNSHLVLLDLQLLA